MGSDDGQDNEEENFDARGRADQHPIPVLIEQTGRRPYQALARENADGLNVLLTRQIPALTQQIQHTTNLMNQLIQRQLDIFKALLKFVNYAIIKIVIYFQILLNTEVICKDNDNLTQNLF